MTRLAQLRQRRDMLRLRSERLRQEFAEEERALHQSLAGIEQATALARKLTSPLGLVAAGALAVALLKPVRVLGWVTRGLVLVSVVKRVMELVQVFRARASAPPQ